MTIQFGAGNKPPVDLLAFSEGLFKDAADELSRALEAVQAGELATPRPATQLVKDLKDAFKHVMDERKRIDSVREQTTGHGTGTLDFDAARDEIGRRLACLRDAGSGG
jgi:hypothetical protein